MDLTKIKSLDIKTIAIIVLGIALVISFLFGQKSHIDTHKDEIANLHKLNSSISSKNDSLVNVNKSLDMVINEINKKLNDNSNKLANTEIELDKLKKRKNEIPTYVNNLSANGVSNAFSNYLETKGSNAN